MAASPLPYSPPQWRDSFSAFAGRGDWTPELLAEARKQVSKTCADNQRLLEEMRADTEKFLDKLIARVEADNTIDLDEALSVFEKFEDRLEDDREHAVKGVNSTIKELSRTAPSALPLLNDYRTEMKRSYNELSAVFRDARWRVMAARARYQPSAGVGPIHGSGEPPDDAEAA